VFFDVGSSATLGTGTQFAGNIIAQQSITLTTGASILCGRAMALTGAVTLDTNSISRDCNAMNFSTQRSDFGSAGFSGVSAGTSPAPVPEPSVIAIMTAGLAGLAVVRGRRPRRSLAPTHPSV
jgi:type VI secretion system secreted protein VgrG